MSVNPQWVVLGTLYMVALMIAVLVWWQQR